MEMITGPDDGGRRLDRVLRKALPGLPLSALHRMLRQGLVLVDGEAGEAALRVKPGSVINILNEEKEKPQRTQNLTESSQSFAFSAVKSSVGLDIILEEGGLLFLNKPAGIAAHGPDSLESSVRAYLEPRLPPSLSFRPGPLHRLDTPSSGLIVFPASLEGARRFSALLQERRVRKTYLALVEGRIENEEVWKDTLIRDRYAGKTFTGKNVGKAALTRVRPLAVSARYSLILTEIETGRTHQIRAQAAERGHPLAGDRKYGGHPLSGSGQGIAGRTSFFLHAWKLTLPVAGGPAEGPLTVTAPIPPAFLRRIAELFGELSL